MLVINPIQTIITIIFVEQNFVACDYNWTQTHNHLVHKRTLNY